MTYENIGQAVLILGSIYLYFTYNLSLWIVVPLILLAIATMTYPGFTNERKKKLKAEIDLLEAKTEYYRRRTS